MLKTPGRPAIMMPWNGDLVYDYGGIETKFIIIIIIDKVIVLHADNSLIRGWTAKAVHDCQGFGLHDQVLYTTTLTSSYGYKFTVLLVKEENETMEYGS
ncbi:hypothetical protein Dsin_014692 [Dipteronia sinensis]|uniref:Uncharacterized protein n=1 Tax=Dipteronia sinensis TaxID=43782 RepID=A0AAE0ANM6_9ROSI|nr:hypothetical protein Dsin_014692 [Dipteronia sinensis]